MYGAIAFVKLGNSGIARIRQCIGPVHQSVHTVYNLTCLCSTFVTAVGNLLEGIFCIFASGVEPIQQIIDKRFPLADIRFCHADNLFSLLHHAFYALAIIAANQRIRKECQSLFETVNIVKDYRQILRYSRSAFVVKAPDRIAFGNQLVRIARQDAHFALAHESGSHQSKLGIHGDFRIRINARRHIDRLVRELHIDNFALGNATDSNEIPWRKRTDSLVPDYERIAFMVWTGRMEKIRREPARHHDYEKDKKR